MRSSFLLFALGLLVTSPALAEEHQFSWTCKAGAGQFSRNGVDTSSGMTISGTIEFKEFNARSKWAPGAAINFRRVRGENKFGGLAFYFAEANDNMLTVGLNGFDGGPRRAVRRVKMDGPIPFSVEVDPTGSVTATVGGQIFVAKGRAFKGGISEVSCSSATVEFVVLNNPIIDY